MPKEFKSNLKYNGTILKYADIRLSYCKPEKNNSCIDL